MLKNCLVWVLLLRMELELKMKPADTEQTVPLCFLVFKCSKPNRCKKSWEQVKKRKKSQYKFAFWRKKETEKADISLVVTQNSLWM